MAIHRTGGGSIPACAGEPSRATATLCAVLRPGRSIPACAGEPISARFAYPRNDAGGLSPRVRGEPSMCARSWRPGGSIPACAGEPSMDIDRAGAMHIPVYPRVCGGTAHWHCRIQLPPCRVYPRVCGGTCLARHTRCRRHTAVYPRVCGGTSNIRLHGCLCNQTCGLSPRVRGNPASTDGNSDMPAQRSIPACAGEPGLGSRNVSLASRVYPRVCGGTTSNDGMSAGSASGLSPRVRGNRRPRRCHQ